MRGMVLWASTALLAAGCTAYKPVDQGSPVPWADALATRRAALVQPHPSAGPQETTIRTASQPRGAGAEPAAGSGGSSTGTIRISPLAEDAPPSDATRPPQAEIVEAETVEVQVAAVEPAASTPETHTVAKGEWLLGLARQYQVDPKALAAANALESPYTLRTGQVLTIPQAEQTTVVTTVEATVVREEEPAVAAPGASSEATYVVQKGDALGAIARRNGLSTRELAAANGLVSPYPLRPGQELSIPDREAGTEVAAVLPAEPAPAPEPAPAADTSGFLWPVDGKVIARFGEEKDGESRSGIAIEARKGAPVKAAQRGVVVYAGDAIRGYGRMILLRHDDGYVTAYGHNSALLVNVGATVERGQVIARVGDTGGVPTPQLHFEVRKGKQPIDPETVLASQPGTATG